MRLRSLNGTGHRRRGRAAETLDELSVNHPELLAVYVAEGAEIAVLDGDSYPIAHPWRGKRAWAEHGIVILSRPGDAYSVWPFWEGPRRQFAGWARRFESK